MEPEIQAGTYIEQFLTTWLPIASILMMLVIIVSLNAWQIHRLERRIERLEHD